MKVKKPILNTPFLAKKSAYLTDSARIQKELTKAAGNCILKNQANYVLAISFFVTQHFYDQISRETLIVFFGVLIKQQSLLFKRI